MALGALSLTVVWAQEKSAIKTQSAQSAVTVHQLFLADQRDRGDPPAKSYPADVNGRDAARRSQRSQSV